MTYMIVTNDEETVLFKSNKIECINSFVDECEQRPLYIYKMIGGTISQKKGSFSEVENGKNN